MQHLQKTILISLMLSNCFANPFCADRSLDQRTWIETRSMDGFVKNGKFYVFVGQWNLRTNSRVDAEVFTAPIDDVTVKLADSDIVSSTYEIKTKNETLGEYVDFKASGGGFIPASSVKFGEIDRRPCLIMETKNRLRLKENAEMINPKSQGLVSLELREANLLKVIEGIAQIGNYNFKVISPPENEVKVSTSIRNKSVNQALAQIAIDSNTDITIVEDTIVVRH